MLRDEMIAVLKAAPKLPTVHWAMPNPNNAGRDADLVDAIARVTGGIAVHCNASSIEWGLGVQQRTACSLALLLWHNSGYVFDSSGPPALEAKMAAIRDQFPTFKPRLVIAHRESGSSPNPVRTCPLAVSVEYYSAVKRVWGDVPFTAYATGWLIGYGADGRRAEYEQLAPFDCLSFDLYMESVELFRKTIQLNVEQVPDASWVPWLALIGAYRNRPKAFDARPWLSPVQWDRAFRREPAVDCARGFMLLARKVRELKKLDGVCIYPAFPDLPHETVAMVNALAAYACGWAEKWPPAKLVDLSESEPTDPDPDPQPEPETPPAANPAGLEPIAAWLSVPGQPAGSVELFAESKPGIWGVQFAWPGGAKTVRGEGPTYKVTVPAGDVRATVIGVDGGRRELAITIGSGGPRRVANRTLTAADAAIVGSGEVWLDGCVIQGDGKTKGHPVGGNVSALYMTNCAIRDVHRAQGATPRLVLMCDCIVENIREDVSQNGETLARVTVRGVHPAIGNAATGEPEHADVVQGWGGTFGPRIVYQVSGSDLDYQGIFMRATDPAGIRGLAIVDCVIALNAPWWGCGNGIQGRLFHGVITRNLLTGFGRTESGAGDLWIGGDKAGGSGWTDVRFNGNAIDSISVTVPPSAFVNCDFRDNVFAGVRKDGLP